MQGTLRSAVIGRFANAKRFGGFADPREAAAQWFYGERMVRSGKHVVEQGAALLSEVSGVALRPVPAELPREAWAEDWAEDLVGGESVCVLAASAGWGAKQWPWERYAELARALRGRGFQVLTNAPRKDDPVAEGVVGASGGAAELVACNVTGLIALLRRAAVVVGGDSGPVHLAAALGVPVVGLYGPTDPERNGPWGPGRIRVLRHPASVTSYKRVQETDAGLQEIGVEEVAAAVAGVVDAFAEGTAGSLRE
jgi:heptosyltransferase-1